jgi:hypothetical protein
MGQEPDDKEATAAPAKRSRQGNRGRTRNMWIKPAGQKETRLAPPVYDETPEAPPKPGATHPVDRS